MALLMVACGDAKNSGNTTSKASVNGEPATVYYAQFVTKKNATSASDLKLLVASADLPQASSTIRVSLEIFLFDDNTFQGDYKDPNAPNQNIVVKGKWRVDETKIMIGDLGVGTGLTINGNKAILLKMSKDIFTPGLKGKSFAFTI